MMQTAIACLIGGLLICVTAELRPVGSNARAAANLLGVVLIGVGLVLTIRVLS